MRHDGTMRAARASAGAGRARGGGRKGARGGRSGGSGGPVARRSAVGRSEAGASGTGGEPPRVSLYAEVTARIIAELEAGRFPWVQPWSTSTAAPGLPCNAVTGRRYSGINILLLWGAVI